MSNPTHISVLPENIEITAPNAVTIQSHSLKTLVSQDPGEAAKLINENGFSITPEKLTWGPDGRVTIEDLIVKDKIQKALNKGSIAALNICGLCKVDA